MMKRLLQLIVLAVVLYAGYQYLRPWILEWDGEVDITGNEAQQCVARIELTRNEVVDKVEKWMGPPVEVNRWAGASRLLRGRMDDLRRECSCTSDACQLALEAVDELDRALSRIDGELRAGRTVSLREELSELEHRIALARSEADSE